MSRWHKIGSHLGCMILWKLCHIFNIVEREGSFHEQLNFFQISILKKSFFWLVYFSLTSYRPIIIWNSYLFNSVQLLYYIFIHYLSISCLIKHREGALISRSCGLKVEAFIAKLSPSPSLSWAELVIFSINPATRPPTHHPPTHPDKSKFYV